MSIKWGVILAVIGCIVFFFCIAGWGVDWKLIGQDVNGSVLEIDVASISRPSGSPYLLNGYPGQLSNHSLNSAL